MANIPAIALSNALNATKLLDRALDDLEQNYIQSELTRDKLLVVRKLQGDNSRNKFRLEQLSG